MSFYSVAKSLVHSLLGLIAQREYTGLERFPEPPYILMINHLSTFDAPVVLDVCPHTIRALAASKHKRNPIYGPLLAAMDVIWVRRGEVDRQALRGAFHTLEQGKVLGLAPEGTRARGTYSLQKAKTGIAYVAARSGALIVPLALSGTEQVKHNLPRLRRTHIRAAVGEPFRLPESGRVRGEKLEEYTDLIMRRLASLLPRDYRGVYA